VGPGEARLGRMGFGGLVIWRMLFVFWSRSFRVVVLCHPFLITEMHVGLSLMLLVLMLLFARSSV
jgi:hypothetical protein